MNEAINITPQAVVVYMDAPWSVTAAGAVDGNRATIERRVFGDRVTVRFGIGIRRDYSDGALAELVHGADAIVIHRYLVTPELLDAAGPRLRVVARQGVGIDNLRPALLRDRGIIGFNVPDYCIDEVATHTVALALALERHIVTQHQLLTGGRFDIYGGGIPRRLQRCCAGVLGFGRIGRVVAARLRQFYGRLLACDPYVSSDLIESYGVHKVDFDTLLKQSDIILLHCLLNEETSRIMDSHALSKMKRDALLVNAARGGLVDAKALHEALSRGLLGGAALDVFVPEDPNESEWYRATLARENVIVTSHRAFLSRESEDSQPRRIAEGIRHVL